MARFAGNRAAEILPWRARDFGWRMKTGVVTLTSASVLTRGPRVSAAAREKKERGIFRWVLAGMACWAEARGLVAGLAQVGLGLGRPSFFI